MKRQRAERLGRWAESLAALWLMVRGYRILARRLRTPAGEIDLLAKRGNCLVIVEVKARGSVETAAGSIAPRQRARLEAAARWLPSWRPVLAGCDIRFDAVLIAPGRLPRHVKDAWRPEHA